MKKFIINNILRITLFQPLWEKLHSISVLSMNFWGGAKFDESGELWIIKNILKKKNSYKIFFDVGANQGLYALAMHKIMGNQIQQYCFEPSQFTFKELTDKVGHIKSIKLFNVGFSDQDETLTLHYTDESDGLSSIYGNNPLTQFNKKEEIQLTTISSFCKANQIEEIDFLKVDVEGHEYKVLLGVTDMIKSRKIKMIQFEMGECNIVSRTFFRDFYELLHEDYDIYRVLPHGLRPIKSYNTIHEIFACINYLAILKTK